MTESFRQKKKKQPAYISKYMEAKSFIAPNNDCNTNKIHCQVYVQ